jgi:hypothetical protein
MRRVVQPGGAGFIVRGECCRYSGGLAPAACGEFRCPFKWFCCRSSSWSLSGRETTQIGNCFSDQFELPVLFYVLIALALPLRHADFVIVLLSWVFVVIRFAHAGIFVTSNNAEQRSLAWSAGGLVLFAMWLYFALKVLLLI